MVPASCLGLLGGVVTAGRRAILQGGHDVDRGIQATGIWRLRLSAFTLGGSASAVLRFVPYVIPPLADLAALPRVALKRENGRRRRRSRQEGRRGLALSFTPGNLHACHRRRTDAIRRRPRVTRRETPGSSGPAIS